MRRKFVFVYNVFMNVVAFALLFPTDAGGRTLYWEDVFPLNLPAMIQEADKRLEIYEHARFRIKISFPYEQDWIFAEYALEQARLHTVARALTLSPAKLYCQRASGKVWLDICFNHLLPSKMLSLGPAHQSSLLANIYESNPAEGPPGLMPISGAASGSTSGSTSGPALMEQIASASNTSNPPNAVLSSFAPFNPPSSNFAGNKSPAQAHPNKESPNAYLRDFNYRLWFCYYNQNYALYYLQQSFYYLQFGSSYQEELFTQPEEYISLLLNSICLEPGGASPSLAFKIRYPGAGVKYGCYQEALPKQALAYISRRSDLRNNPGNPVSCGKILGYLESAGLGATHQDKLVRFYAEQYLKHYPLPLPGREELCE